MNEYKLSDFIEEDLYVGRPEDREEVNKSKGLLHIPVLKVKEFIRLLKEYVNKFKCEECCLESIFIKEIDNLVGDLK